MIKDINFLFFLFFFFRLYTEILNSLNLSQNKTDGNMKSKNDVFSKNVFKNLFLDYCVCERQNLQVGIVSSSLGLKSDDLIDSKWFDLNTPNA